MSEFRKVGLPDGGFLHAQMDAGPSGAPVLILSNSVLTDLRVWDGQVAALTAAYSVLRYDQRGHGQSSISTGPMSFDQYGMDALAVLDAFDCDDCVFVGLSMGVPTGLAAFAQAPSRFRAFVAVDGVAKSAPGRETFWSERRAAALDTGLDGLAAAQRWLPEASDDLTQALADMIAATPVEGFAAATHALQSYDYSNVAASLSLPFLAIAGAEDGSMPDAMRGQFDAVPGARFETIERAGHVPNFQRPEVFNEILLAFLADCSTRKTL